MCSIDGYKLVTLKRTQNDPWHKDHKIGLIYVHSEISLINKMISERARLPNEIVPMKAETKEDAAKEDTAKKLIDTNLFTRAILVKNDSTNSSWIKISLDRPYFITKVVLYNKFFVDWYVPDDVCVVNTDHFKTCNSKIDGLKVTVSEKICATLQVFPTALDQKDQVYSLLCNVEGKEVLLSKTEEGKFSIRDVAILGYTTGMLHLQSCFLVMKY